MSTIGLFQSVITVMWEQQMNNPLLLVSLVSCVLKVSFYIVWCYMNYCLLHFEILGILYERIIVINACSFLDLSLNIVIVYIVGKVLIMTFQMFWRNKTQEPISL